MRITPQQLANNTVNAANQHSRRLAELQNQVSSGIRLQKPSDSPAELGDLLAGKSLLGRLEVDLQNVASVRSTLNQTVSQLLSAKEAFTRAKTLAVDGVQSLEKDAIALEVNGILDLIVEIANSTDGANALFSGIAGQRPFDVSDVADSGETKEVNYSGLGHRSQIVVGRELFVEAYYSGEEVFMSTDRGDTFYSSKTGATQGTGTDTFAGEAKLSVRQTSISLGGSSGVALGANPVQGNALIGQSDLHINAVDGTIQLGAGPVRLYDGTETAFRVVDEHGAGVEVDTTGINAGFNGTVTVSAEGAFSFDGGATEVAIDFSGSQVWEHAGDAGVTYVDTRNIRQAGVDHVETVGTNDAFRALARLRDELRNDRGLEGDDWNAAMQRRLADIDRIGSHLLKVVGDASVSLKNLEAIELRAEDYQIQTTAHVSDLESTDMVSAIAELQSEQNLLQYTYAASANLINGTNLLDYLR